MNTATELTLKEHAGVASGVSLTIGSVAFILVPPIFGLTVDLNGDFQLLWLFMAVSMIISSFVLLVLRKMRSF
jgi:ACS family hexuronate transporter-like MFS transporter